MKIIRFEKLSLFKGSNILPPKNRQKKETASILGLVFSNPIFYIVLFSAIISFSLSFFPARPLPMIKVGEIATKDIISPLEITVEDVEATEKRKTQAEESIPPVYFYNQRVITNTQEKIRQFFTFGRNWLATSPRNIKELQKNFSETFGLDLDENTISGLVKLKFSNELEQLLQDVISPILKREIVLSRNFLDHGETERGLLVIRGKEEKLLKVADILELKEARTLLASEINALELPVRTKSVLKVLAPMFISPTITYDQAETDIRRLRARNSVEPVFYTIKKGRVIIRKGDEATAETIKQIILINQKIGQQKSWIINFIGLFILYLIIFFLIWEFFHQASPRENRLALFNMTGFSLLASFVIYKASLFIAEALSTSFSLISLEKEALAFATPFQTGTFLFAVGSSPEFSIPFCLFNSLLAAQVLGNDYYILLFTLVGGIAAIYGMKYYFTHTRSAVLKAGLTYLAPLQIILVIIFQMIRDEFNNFSFLGTAIFSGMAGALLSAAIAFVLMPVYESIFGILTPSKLHEITNSDLPIFKKLAIEAPGTYHHSLIVATLAEKAAEEIKADPLLVKAGGLYHDIGKLKRPEYFSENQSSGLNVHQELTPSLSTLVIINHVKDGIEMAKSLKLPKRIIDIIAQHHGTTIVRYFFQKAKEKYNPELHKIEPEDFRYPGPIPKSKEAGLIMLADSVEAAARSLKSVTREKLKRLITEIFNSLLQDGQLDECGFSLKELRSVANSFLSTLDAIYHPRPAYPGFDFEKGLEHKEGVKKNNGGNYKQAEENPSSDRKD
ncbi:MAG: HDIG domain-containing protein [Candidatus Aminicenantes bacterium]|nr:HDIG domain-containing protein [Candidatus Aminicenantes bacterium]